ncbi:serine/threonine protein kinase, partial [filamentous cyanobacterium CCP1]
MSYCLNPACPNPENLANTELCQACGSKLLLRDRYRVVQALGQGGFGATFLAKDESLPGSPYCVIKQLRPVATSPHVMQMARELFQREAKTLGKIGNHPQVPRLLDYFEAHQEFYLVQEYISGSTLQQEVKRSGPFSEAGVKQFLSEVLPMLQYIHGQQVIHRDIKPANLIRRSQDKKLVLIDFGAVKDQVNPVRAGASEQTALTAYAIGTPGYAPPEQMAMRPVYASDIYALGVTCLYLLTGRSPKDMDYDPATGEVLWREQVHISDHFAEVLEKMLEVSVRHRYQNAVEVLRALDLEPYLDSLAQGMVSQANRPARRNGPLPSSGERSDGNTSPSSPSARLAAAIRARQNKAE